MQNINLYPELVDYIYNFECRFFDDDELIASGKLRNVPKYIGVNTLKFVLSNLKCTSSEKMKVMLADGLDAFKIRVVTRIYAQHKNEIVLNLCPKCGKIARTPLAKQCRFCFNNWHC